MGVKIKASNKIVEIKDQPQGTSAMSKYWDGTRNEFRIKITEYELNSAFQEVMLDLFQVSEMTEYGRVRWALRMDKVDKSWGYDVVLFQVPDVENFR